MWNYRNYGHLLFNNDSSLYLSLSLSLSPLSLSLSLVRQDLEWGRSTFDTSPNMCMTADHVTYTFFSVFRNYFFVQDEFSHFGICTPFFCIYNFVFEYCNWSYAAEVPVKFQSHESNWKCLNPNLAASRLREILWSSPYSKLIRHILS